jgi:hypothetical protein
MKRDDGNGCTGQWNMDKAPGAYNQPGSLLASEGTGEPDMFFEGGKGSLEVVCFVGGQGWPGTCQSLFTMVHAGTVLFELLGLPGAQALNSKGKLKQSILN